MKLKLKRESQKKNKDQKNKLDFTINQALIFSAIMIIVFTIIMIYCFWEFQAVPDSLVVAFFGAFGLEGGYCAFIHKIKKESKMRLGDLTGFDDAEVLDEQKDEDEDEDEDEVDDNDLVIDNEGEY